MTGRLFKMAMVIAGLAAGVVLAAVQSLPTRTDEAHIAEEPTRLLGVRLKLILKIVAVLGILAVLGGLLVSTSGLIPIKASSGHWAITHWFLQFSKERSVATNTLGIAVPPLDDPALVLKGAGHFETGCAPCHGSPQLNRPRIAWRMTPNAPQLAESLSQWESEELFYIVKHGIKFTGMPAWPSPQRDDEVWAMVAFLRQLPSLDAARYRHLVSGAGEMNAAAVPLADLVTPAGTPHLITENCARCHGFDGQGRGLGAFPKLAGQNFEYLAASLQAYARSQRHSGIMEPVAAGLAPEEIRELARYYASLPRSAPSMHEAAAVERGSVIAAQGIVKQRVPACAACHGPKLTPRNPIYPELSAQYADYLVLQLRLFKQEQRGGTPYAHLMRQVAAGLTAEQMREVALYYASLPVAPDAGAR